ncbi:MAG: rhodanese-like domain-containing protein [Thermoguttaceae bacterium]
MLKLFLVIILCAGCGFVYAEDDTIKSDESPVQVETKPKPLAQLKEVEVSGPYCGIYSLIAVFDTFGVYPELEELFVPEFVGSFDGSTNTELIKAAEKFGLHGKTHSSLTWDQIKDSKSPMILHYRSSYADTKFNHWVAFLGIDNGFARIIDLPHQITMVPPAELLAQWDGTAIEISDKPITNSVLIASKKSYLMLVITVLAIAVVAKLFWKKSDEAFLAPTLFQRLKRGVVQTSLLLGSLFVAGVLFHAFAGIGFLKNPTAVAEVTRRYYSVNIPEIGITEMEKIVADKSASIFDARYMRDYNSGTIPGAVSLPINSILSERQEILTGVEKGKRIVVFCQSSGCGYADEVAQFLKFNGYHDVVIYRGGYREWKTQQEKQ